MYNRMYKFFSENNLIYPSQFGFRQKCSTVHALISLRENFRKKLDKGNIGYGILSAYRKHLIQLNMIFFYESLNNMAYVVLLMNGLNPITQIENNMFQLIDMILILLM